MAGIPPNWLGSIIQTQGAQQRAAANKAKEGASQSEGTGGEFADRLQDVIESSDRDSQVYSDAEGAGSQGRPFEGAEEESQQDTPEIDSEPQGGGLDVEA